MSQLMMLGALLKRQQCNGGECFTQGPQGAGTSTQPTSAPNPSDTDSDDDYWPDSDAGHVVRYIILAVIILVIVLWLVFGIWHANMRLRKGLQPLWYHRWLVPSRARRYPQRQYQQAWPHYGNQYYNPQTGAYGGPPVAPGQSYPMHTWNRSENAPPPPAYTNDSPPTYVPPPGPPPGREPKGSDVVAPTVSSVGDSGLQNGHAHLSETTGTSRTGE